MPSDTTGAETTGAETTGAETAGEIGRSRRGGSRAHADTSRRTWLEGSATTRAWNSTVLAYAALCVGAGILLSVALPQLIGGVTGGLLALIALWLGMLVPIVIAIARTRPRGLFRFRWTDLLWGIGLGVLLRLVQGWLEMAAGSSGGLPAYPLLDGSLSTWWWLTALLGPVVVAPLLEEFLFRGVILVTVFRTAKRGLDAAILAIVSSTGLFVALHAVRGLSRWDEVVYLVLVGLVAAVLVLLTGRIWGAVILHVVFNASFVVLALAGTYLG